MSEEVITTAVRLAVASGLLSWPLAIAVVILLAVVLAFAPRVWKAIPSGVFFPRVEVPPPPVAPPLVASPDGSFHLDQKPPDFLSP